MSELAERFISSLIKSGDTGEYLKLGNVEAVFEHVKSDADLFIKFSEFISKYGKIPAKETFEDSIGKSLPKAKEVPQYYFDKLMERHIKKTLIKSSQVATDYLREKDVQKAFDEMHRMVNSIILQKMSPQIYDFRNIHDMMAHELQMKMDPEYGIQLGWGTLDNMIGGLRGGDVLSKIGRPASGKSMLSLYNAMYAWEEQQKSPLFVSMEMNPITIFERLAALEQHIPYNRVKHGEFTTYGGNQRKQFLDGLLRLQNDNLPPFHVVDGNLTASISDIINIASYLKPSLIVVDGAYLVEAPSRRSHDKIPEVCKGLKMAIATNMGIPVISSWQFNREATKLKKTEKAGMQHIAGSDVIPQISSVVLSLDQEESIETAHQRWVRILKGRGGEMGGFSINWDWRKMQFDEVDRIEDHEVMIT